MIDRRFKALASIWSPDSFIQVLKVEGFKVDEESRFAVNWESLLRPATFSRKDERKSCYTFLNADHAFKNSELSEWGLVLVDLKLKAKVKSESNNILFTSNPDAALDFILGLSSPQEWVAPQPYHNPHFPSQVTVESGVLIGPGSEIGENSVIEANCRIGARVKIGKNTRIGANTRIGDDTVIGDDCVITGLASIGGQGFGLLRYPGDPHLRQRKHVGRVVIGNQVRIGAQVAIDRGVFEDTVISHHSCLDNLIQVAHNCKLGEDNVICSFVGLSGSTKIGDRVTIAGMVGTKDHVSIGSDVVVAGQSGVNGDIPPKQAVKGYPPRPVKDALKINVLIGKLPEIYERLKALEKRFK